MEALRQQQKILERQQIRVKRLLYVVVIGLVTVLAAFAVTIVYIVVVSKGNKESTCAVIETNRVEKRAQLRAFEETPPTTDTGRNLETSYRNSLVAWDRLWSAVDCKQITK